MAPRSGPTITDWRQSQATIGAAELLTTLRQQLSQDDPAWIQLASEKQLLTQLRCADPDAPLYGVPVAIKDNIDATGFATTAACPDFSYWPEQDAEAVSALKAAGAIIIGKTNLDQFATGLVGTRSPYGAVPNSFDERFIGGGSSSGSASVVARGLIPIALGTDTAGSGRVPAGLNNIIGLKPTRGAISIKGVVPACRSLDCVSVFAHTLSDAETVRALLEAVDTGDSFSRPRPACAEPGECAFRQDTPLKRLAIPADPPWFEDTLQQRAWEAALARWRQQDTELVPLDFTQLQAMAALLYEGPWVAERYAAVGSFMETHHASMNPVVHDIIAKATNHSAVDAFEGIYRLAELRSAIDDQLAGIDGLLVPTAPIAPTIEAVEADPIRLNSRMGTYTNFVNLGDMSALSIPAGFRDDGIPFGVTLISGAWKEAHLQARAADFLNAQPTPLGATGVSRSSETAPATPSRTVDVAVVGAHLTGMPLNHQLTDRQATLIEETTTSPDYRLYALSGTTPPKPGLSREPQGAPIPVEVWRMPLARFGDFVALIPPPLGIGSVQLASGAWVKGFICEKAGLGGALDITDYGGWRAYIKSG
ncbi:MAG: allophanate hydrolase [Pseudomonadota bacterium]